ncbi:histidine phosphatase family protein [Salibacterium salarium]|uniref:Histidine phosphatase family protein n=1 Tax=Salibacterium salarium TaxID=284579 RepID=A0A428MZR1_9BACI|nr:histidine phosphatase family protein [Salibacterium salarium]RSL31640.1 histidine phosphatase family protein [Salibacterium salarium]
MEIYLIRHGESEGNRTAKLQGCEDFDLTTQGKRQALSLGDFFANVTIDYLYSSDLTRASETAKAVERHQNCEVVHSSEFREINLGPLQGKTREQIYEEFPQVRNKNLLRSGLDGTETDEEITRRCEYLYRLLKSVKNEETAAIVSHGGFLTIFLMYLLAGENWNTLHRPFRINNTGVSKISWNEDRLVIHYINQTHHLKDE